MRRLSALSPWLVAIAAMACADEPTAAPDVAGLHASHVHAAPVSGARAAASTSHLKLLAEIRAATARYHRVEAAEADGYVLNSPCVASPAGAMGHHYAKFANFDGVVDPVNPEVLVYLPDDGRLRLVAVEYIVVAAAWDATHADPPLLGEQVFDDFSTGPNFGGPPFPNYQLHAWLWAHNPAGMHAPFNPAIACPAS